MNHLGESLAVTLLHGCAADPQSGYTIILAGRQYVFGGTSAVAPMWAAWKAATDAVAGKTLPFSAEVRPSLKASGETMNITLNQNNKALAAGLLVCLHMNASAC